MLMEKKKISEYESMRVVLTILVIISHCQYYRILTPYGGVDFLFADSDGLIAFRLLNLLWRMIYAFHMAAFIALSGALFRVSCERRPDQSLRALSVSKAKRLLIPFAAVTLLYAIPVKLATGYWSSSSDLVRDAGVGQFLLQGNTHLWFLPTLFGAFIAVFLLNRLPLPSWAFFGLLLAAHAVSGFIPINAVSYVFEYTVWFYCGYVFEGYRARVNASHTTRNTVIAAVLFLAVFAVSRHLGSKLVRIPSGVVLALLGMYITYVLSWRISHTRLCETRFYRGLVRNSFGLYLYSDPLNYVVLAVSAVCFGRFAFTTNAGILMMFVLRFAVTQAGAYAVSELIRRTKIKYLV